MTSGSKQPRVVGGFTLIETMMATGIAGVIIAALFTSSMLLQRSFQATQAYAASKRDQMRLTDYLALDLRRALTLQAAPGGNTVLTLTIPDFYEADGTPRNPTPNRLVADYGDPAKPVTVTYFKDGASIYRRQNSDKATEIASGVEDFAITIEDLKKVVKTRVSFIPTFRKMPGEATRESTVLHNTVLLRNKRRG